MPEIKSHKDLNVWKAAMDMVVTLYDITATFPSTEIYGLTSQIRRAAVAIPSNISEGCARKGSAELTRFLYISLGSLAEIETQLEIAVRLGYIADFHQIEEKIIYIRRMIVNLIKSLKN
ncbi:four helix bundle protein [Haoranjiania flava]|uniref:Four helix bundle protein n=1 Tax=Haoranjiania flava TaxID=1856322 RepID=A0AAE3IRT6_9BACT|nr:four helix bundle protein [Haoranjiania flava]MCU7694592.1 four helix bundle protein [Haoranjiania flava]